MRKLVQLFVLIPLLAAGLLSCNKEEEVVKDRGTGNVKMSFGFSENPEGRAVPASGKKPTTSWRDNVKDLIILFAKDGVVVDARSVTPPTAADLSEQSVSLKNIPANTDCDVYVVANSGQTGISRPGWTPENAKGRRTQDLLMALTTATMPAGVTGTGYNSPAEIFMANQRVTIQADKDNNITTPFALTRVVSLIRVRLVPKGDNLSKIDFTGAGKAFVFLRRVSPSMNVLKTFTTVTPTDGVFVNQPFLGTEPNTGYAGTGNILDAANGVTCYRDFLCFPGGSATAGAQKFDIMIKGTTKTTDYIPAGATTPLAINTPVYWSGAISQAVASNGILEVVVTVQSVGDKDEPEVGSYGNLTIKVNLVPWGNITQTELPV